MKSLELLEARQRIVELERCLRMSISRLHLRRRMFDIGQEAIRENATLKRRIIRRDNEIARLKQHISNGL